MIKKVLSSVLSFALVLALMPMQAMAEPQTQSDTDIPSTTSQPALEQAASELEVEEVSQQDASASIASPQTETTNTDINIEQPASANADEPKVTDASKFNSMPDKALVDSWATDGTKWCMEKGIISGVDVPGDSKKYIDPFGSAFRGSMITMLVRGEEDLI